MVACLRCGFGSGVAVRPSFRALRCAESSVGAALRCRPRPSARLWARGDSRPCGFPFIVSEYGQRGMMTSFRVDSARPIPGACDARRCGGIAPALRAPQRRQCVACAWTGPKNAPSLPERAVSAPDNSTMVMDSSAGRGE